VATAPTRAHETELWERWETLAKKAWAPEGAGLASPLHPVASVVIPVALRGLP